MNAQCMGLVKPRRTGPSASGRAPTPTGARRQTPSPQRVRQARRDAPRQTVCLHCRRRRRDAPGQPRRPAAVGERRRIVACAAHGAFGTLCALPSERAHTQYTQRRVWFGYIPAHDARRGRGVPREPPNARRVHGCTRAVHRCCETGVPAGQDGVVDPPRRRIDVRMHVWWQPIVISFTAHYTHAQRRRSGVPGRPTRRMCNAAHPLLYPWQKKGVRVLPAQTLRGPAPTTHV